MVALPNRAKAHTVAISMVKNEVDVIEAFVRHTLVFCDRLIVLDNQSLDGTYIALLRLAEEGLSLTVIRDKSSSYNQRRKLTYLYFLALRRYSPDFIVPLDSDEFIQARSPQHFREQLRHIPKGGLGSWYWRNYMPVRLDSKVIVERFCQYRMDQPSRISKVIIRTLGGPIDFLALMDVGSHGLTRFLGKSKIYTFQDQEMHLAHLPLRSAFQYLTKILLGEMALIRYYGTRRGGIGWHTRMMYQNFLAGNAISDETLFLDAYNYSVPEDFWVGEVSQTRAVQSSMTIFPSSLSLVEPYDETQAIANSLRLLCKTYEKDLLLPGKYRLRNLSVIGPLLRFLT